MRGLTGGRQAAPLGVSARPRPRGAWAWRKYSAAFRVSLLTQLAYAGELWVRTIFLLLILFIFASLWHATYAELGRPRLGGFTPAQMLTYLAITESVILSRTRGTLRFDEDVRTGAIAYALARPYHYVLYRYAEVSAERLLRLGLNLLVALPLAWLFAGGAGLSAAGLLPGLLVLAGAVTADFLLLMAVQLLAFWVEDTNGLQFIYDRLLLLLGGVLLPLSLFPGPLADVARALPFSALIYDPARTFVAFDGREFGALLARQGAALAMGALLAAAVFRAGARRVQLNGG
jgi:ABC-2 type transport system permease protein